MEDIFRDAVDYLGDRTKDAFSWLGGQETKNFANLGRRYGSKVKTAKKGLEIGAGILGAMSVAMSFTPLAFLAPAMGLLASNVGAMGIGGEFVDKAFDNAIIQDEENYKNRIEADRKIPKGSYAGGNAPIGVIRGGGITPISLPMTSDEPRNTILPSSATSRYGGNSAIM